MEKSAWLQWFHRNCNPRNYLQIGVDTGTDLQFALSNTPTIGVDNSPALEHKLLDNQQIVGNEMSFVISDNVTFEENHIIGQVQPKKHAIICDVALTRDTSNNDTLWSV